MSDRVKKYQMLQYQMENLLEEMDTLWNSMMPSERNDLNDYNTKDGEVMYKETTGA